MRCPKCGFISFDHLDNCMKCKREFKGMTGIVQGTIFKVQAPSFLKIQLEPEKKSFGEIEIDGEMEGGEFDLQDPDLEILLDEEGEGEEISMLADSGEGNRELSSGDAFELSLDTAKEDEEEGISIDLGQFQNDLDSGGNAGFDTVSSGKKEADKTQLELPVELADISDLAPPRQKSFTAPVRSPADKMAELDDFDLNLDLDLNSFDGGLAAAPKEKQSSSKGAAFSLDEIDLSAGIKPGGTPRKGEPDAMNMDEEVNFDLDLGGLSMNKD